MTEAGPATCSTAGAGGETRAGNQPVHDLTRWGWVGGRAGRALIPDPLIVWTPHRGHRGCDLALICSRLNPEMAAIVAFASGCAIWPRRGSPFSSPGFGGPRCPCASRPWAWLWAAPDDGCDARHQGPPPEAGWAGPLRVSLTAEECGAPPGRVRPYHTISDGSLDGCFRDAAIGFAQVCGAGGSTARAGETISGRDRPGIVFTGSGAGHERGSPPPAPKRHAGSWSPPASSPPAAR